MMKRFFNFVEIQTKITSLFTFTLTIGFMLFNGIHIKFLPTLLFFASMFIFDLVTTAINNYIDSKGNGQPLDFSRQTSLALIVLMFIISALLGLWLVSMSDLIVLVLGAFCFAVGVLYTYGPIPISRQPYGEIVSGILYGFFIPFILIHVNAPHSMISFQYLSGTLFFEVHVWTMISFFFVFAIPTLLTSSIMLANNTCDVEKDVLVKRYTLPYYIGEKSAIRLMYLLYLGVYLAIVISVVMGVIPVIALVTLVSIPLVLGNVNQFKKDLVKHVSFKYIIKNFIVIMFMYSVSILVGALVQIFF